jgi:hypothetical protein
MSKNSSNIIPIIWSAKGVIARGEIRYGHSNSVKLAFIKLKLEYQDNNMCN